MDDSLKSEIKTVKAELEKLKLKYKDKNVCYFCDATFNYGNSCLPVSEGSRCCDECHKKIIVPYRLYFF